MFDIHLIDNKQSVVFGPKFKATAPKGTFRATTTKKTHFKNAYVQPEIRNSFESHQKIYNKHFLFARK